MMTAIEIIKEAKRIHENWLAYLEANPDSQLLKEYENVGDTAHHKMYIEKYNQVIVDIEQLEADNKRLKEKVIRYEDERELILKMLSKP